MQPGTQLGKYRLKQRLGKGGMGSVYEGLHVELEKPVAVKVLHPSLAERSEVRGRFVREGRAASRIEHPNVVQVFDVGVEGEVPYLVMELLAGETLASLLTRSERLSPTQAADVMVPVISAIATAHSLGVIHRDLKPDNIFLTTKGTASRTPKVVDFGISKIVTGSDTRLTETSALLGTPNYMSPEQAREAKDVSGATDQYSIAVMLYQAVTGRRPFHATSLFNLLNAIVAGDFTKPRELVPELPEDFEQLILRGMAVEPHDRFPDIRAMGKALLPHCTARIQALYEDSFEAGDDTIIPTSITPDDTSPTADTEHEVSTFGKSASAYSVNRDEPKSDKRRWGAMVALIGVTVLGAAAASTMLGDDESSPSTAPNTDPSVAAGSSEPNPSSEPAASSESATPAQAAEQASASPATATSEPEAALVIKRVASEPAGAEVWIDGQEVGKTPYELKLGDGVASQSIELKSKGYESQEQTIERDGPDEINIELKRVVSKKKVPTMPKVPDLAPR